MMGDDGELIIREGLTTQVEPAVSIRLRLVGPLRLNITLDENEAVFSIGQWGSCRYSAQDLRYIAQDILSAVKEMERGNKPTPE